MRICEQRSWCIKISLIHPSCHRLHTHESKPMLTFSMALKSSHMNHCRPIRRSLARYCAPAMNGRYPSLSSNELIQLRVHN